MLQSTTNYQGLHDLTNEELEIVSGGAVIRYDAFYFNPVTHKLEPVDVKQTPSGNVQVKPETNK